jgi:hypothetical protein
MVDMAVAEEVDVDVLRREAELGELRSGRFSAVTEITSPKLPSPSSSVAAAASAAYFAGMPVSTTTRSPASVSISAPISPITRPLAWTRKSP